jgi:glycosyltransferase involved in cell wall biosynthesis
MRIAIVHDWLTTFAGSERVVRELLRMYPQADLYSTIDFLNDADREQFGGHRARTTFAQRLPSVHRHYQAYLPLLMLAVEQIDLSGYDLVISSSHAVAKGVITGPDQVHVSYVHSPMRYAWDLQHQYLREAGLERGVRSMLARAMLHYARLWDTRTAHGVDHFVANSEYIARRIRKVYRREATVIYPPVDVDAFPLREDKDDFYLCAARMVPYKKVGLVVDAFAQMPGRRLVVIGDGPEMSAIRARATRNVELMGHVAADVFRDTLQRARALVFAGEEDFGITMVEALACGTPVIAYGRGGAVEIVSGDTTQLGQCGVFFDDQSAQAVADAVSGFESRHLEFDAVACADRASHFSGSIFREAFALSTQTVHREI